MENGIVRGKGVRAAYDAIKIYLEIFGNKEEPFMKEHLKLIEVPNYSIRGLRRLRGRGFIDIVHQLKIPDQGYKNVYKLSERVLKFPLEEILDMSYYDMSRKIRRGV